MIVNHNFWIHKMKKTLKWNRKKFHRIRIKHWYETQIENLLSFDWFSHFVTNFLMSFCCFCSKTVILVTLLNAHRRRRKNWYWITIHFTNNKKKKECLCEYTICANEEQNIIACWKYTDWIQVNSVCVSLSRVFSLSNHHMATTHTQSNDCRLCVWVSVYRSRLGVFVCNGVLCLLILGCPVAYLPLLAF